MRILLVVALASFACDSKPPAQEDGAKKVDAKRGDAKKLGDAKVDRDGRRGEDGEDGEDGKAGEPGKRGEDGKDGENGNAKPKAFAKDDKAAVLAAYKAASGSDLGDDACVQWPSSFPRVTLVGGFAHDRGCDLDGIFVDGELRTTDADRLGLATRDFDKALLADKEAIARAWVDEVLHAFGGSFATASETAFEIAGSPKFEAPRATMNKIGGVVVEGWVQRPVGMVYEFSYDYRIYRFAPDGKVEAETRNSFTVPGEKVRDAEAKKPK
jgi:hypothetical protein